MMSSGSKRRLGAITKTGNGHVRRVLVEGVWSYRFPARKTKHLQRRVEKTSETVQAIAGKRNSVYADGTAIYRMPANWL